MCDAQCDRARSACSALCLLGSAISAPRRHSSRAHRYRKEDKETKVIEYEQAEIGEYVIIDRRSLRGQVIDEVLGYRLVAGRYQSIIPDDDGRLPCETLGLWIGMQDGRLVLEDMETGERLQKSRELKAENQELKAQNQEWEAKFQALEAENQALKAQNQELKAKFTEWEAKFTEWEAQNQELQTRLRELEAEQERRQSS